MKILIVDDKKENLYLLQHLFTGSGFTVISAQNGAEALGLANTATPDIILTDILMPVMDGYSLCRECKKHEILKNIPFIFYTATYTNPKDEEFALSLGADRFVLKPQEPDVLLGIINSFVTSGEHRLPRPQPVDASSETVVLKEYNQTLIRKLEDKMQQTEENERKLKDYVRELEEHLEERKRAEQALQESEERYRLVLENSMDGILLTSPDNAIFAANKAACDMFRMTEEELRRAPRESLIAPDETRLATLLTKRKKSGRAQGELLMQRKDGTTFPAEISSSLYIDRSGQTKSSMIIRDITERKRNEEDLRAHEIQLESIYNTVGDVIYYVGVEEGEQFRFLSVNSAFAAVTGLAVERIIGQCVHDVIPEPSYSLVRERYHQAIATRTIVRWEETTAYPNGMLTGIVSVAPVFDHTGRCTHLVGSVHDITDRKRYEDHLRDSELRFRSVWELGTDGMRLTNADGTVILANNAYGSIFDKSPADIVGEHFSIIYEKERQQVLRAQYAEQFASRTIKPFLDHEATLWNGRTIALEIKNTFLEIPNQPPVLLSVIRDVTERTSLEKQLLRSQRLESLGTLAGGIAHDLNNVLSPVLLASEALKKASTDPKYLKLVNAIESSARRGSEIVKQILTFARGVEAKKIAVDCRHVVEEVCNIFTETFSRSLSIVHEVAPEVPPVLGDPTHLHQMLMNLGVNARDAMPDGGKLTITCEPVTIDENYARMNIHATPGRYVAFSVKDTGTGMSQEILERLFEPFFTTKEPGMGTGLGLSTVHTIVRSMKGFMTVKSKLGEGSLFTAYLPAAAGATGSDTAARTAPSLQGHGELVLVVDDEDTISDVIRHTLEAANYTVITAPDGVEGVVEYTKHKQEVALVITDIMMPVMDGHQLIVTLRKINPEVKIIASSGMIDRNKLDHDRIEGFLEKPYTSETLLSVVAGVIRGG